MIALFVTASWTVLMLAIATLCVAARNGDASLAAATRTPHPSDAPAWERSSEPDFSAAGELAEPAAVERPRQVAGVAA